MGIRGDYVLVPGRPAFWIAAEVVRAQEVQKALCCAIRQKMKVEQVLKVLVVCSVYMVVGPSLILVNKHILKDLGFRYPM